MARGANKKKAAEVRFSNSVLERNRLYLQGLNQSISNQNKISEAQHDIELGEMPEVQDTRTEQQQLLDESRRGQILFDVCKAIAKDIVVANEIYGQVLSRGADEARIFISLAPKLITYSKKFRNVTASTVLAYYDNLAEQLDNEGFLAEDGIVNNYYNNPQQELINIPTATPVMQHVATSPRTIGTDLHQYRVADLRVYARQRGIAIPSSIRTKNDIIRHIMDSERNRGAMESHVTPARPRPSSANLKNDFNEAEQEQGQDTGEYDENEFYDASDAEGAGVGFIMGRMRRSRPKPKPKQRSKPAKKMPKKRGAKKYFWQ